MRGKSKKRNIYKQGWEKSKFFEAGKFAQDVNKEAYKAFCLS